MNNNGLEMGTF